MGLKDEIQKLRFDTRLVDWNLKHKHVKPEELEQHLNALPDCANNAILIETLEDSPSNGHTDFVRLHS